MKMINANKFQDFINIDNSINTTRKSLAENDKRLAALTKLLHIWCQRKWNEQITFFSKLFYIYSEM